MFRCLVSVVCTDLFRQARTFERSLDLPFIPAPWIELGFTSPSTDWAGEVIDVVYEVETGIYHVTLGDWEGLSIEDFRAELGPEWREKRAA